MKSNEKKLPVIALRGFVVFPYMVMHFDIAREISLNALDEAAKTNNIIFLLSQKDENLEEITENDLYRVGTIAKIKQSIKLKDGNIRILIEGISRA
ncbi:MAG: LON peptidase substrate-binding domain-containing protein, partial [Clostridia bacterium]|nr:LON peptidase substrate-binding domain-containing protein [Clostridia bacterium]